MVEASQIREHLVVHAKGAGTMQGAPGAHIGTIDRVEGSYIKITEKDSYDGRHHWFPLTWVESIDENAVYLDRTAEKAIAEFLDRQPMG